MNVKTWLTVGASASLAMAAQVESFGGIGLQLEAAGSQWTVAAVLPMGPAELAGLNAGDTLLSANGEQLEGQSQEAVLEILRGTPGTSVELAVVGHQGPASYKLERQALTVTFESSNVLGLGPQSTWSDAASALGVAERTIVRNSKGPADVGVVLAAEFAPKFAPKTEVQWTFDRNQVYHAVAVDASGREIWAWTGHGGVVDFPAESRGFFVRAWQGSKIIEGYAPLH